MAVRDNIAGTGRESACILHKCAVLYIASCNQIGGLSESCHHLEFQEFYKNHTLFYSR